MFAPPPQPQSSTRASGESGRNCMPQCARERWPTFIKETMSFPPRPSGLRVLSKKDMLPHFLSRTMILLEILRMAGILPSSL